MFDYTQATKNLFLDYYKNIEKYAIITLFYRSDIIPDISSISCLPLSIFDDYYKFKTVNYIPTDIEVLKDQTFTVNGLTVQRDFSKIDESYKSYIITISRMIPIKNNKLNSASTIKQSNALNTLLSLVKFKE